MKLEDSFLDLKLNENLRAFREKHRSKYLVLFKLKAFLDEVQNCFIDKTVSKQDMFLSASIIELNKLFQSAVLLFERGLPESANIVVRSVLELSFRIIELIRNDDFLQEMIFDINSEALNTLNYIKKKGMYDIIDQNYLEQLLNSCNELNSKNNRSDIRVSQLAKRNGMEKEYILYRTYCDYTHQSAKVIDEIVEIKPNGVNLNGGLRLDDFSESIAMLASITMISFQDIVRHPLIHEKMESQFYLLQNEFVKAFQQ